MNCDSLARWYRWLEYAAFGRELERRREQFLPELTNARCALVLGDGDGRFLAALLRANRQIHVDSVDNSGEMLALARGRVLGDETTGDWQRVNFQHLDARDWQPAGRGCYDLIVTHFFLDCFTTHELAPMVEHIAAVAAPDARWIISEFCQPKRGFGALRAKLWISGLYRLFQLATGLEVRELPDYGKLLEQRDFRLIRRVNSEWGLLVSESWQRR